MPLASREGNRPADPRLLLRGLDFHGSPLATFEKDGERWVVMRPVVESMGLDWSGQRAKLAAQRERFSCGDIPTTGSDGKRYEMTCIPLRRYPMEALGQPEPLALKPTVPSWRHHHGVSRCRGGYG